jgi:HSP20 family protein
MTIVRRNYMVPELENLFNNVFKSGFFNEDREELSTLPAVNVKENEDGFVLEVAAPGYEKDNFDISVENGIMTISATTEEKKEEKEENYTKREFNYTSFHRSFRLPEDTVDESTIKASYKNGILEVFIGKKEEVKPKPPKTIKVS